MLRVLACVTEDHDLRLVVLAGLICLFACFTALGLLARARSATGQTRWKWIAGASAVTGCGVWATHFVAMLAFRPNLPLGYDVDLTMASVAIVTLIGGAGFVLALTLPALAALGGAVVGGGVAAMHYTGMAALHVPAHVHYDAAYVAVSIVLGAGLGAAALWLAFHGKDRRHRLMGTLTLVLAIVSHHFTAMAAITLVPNPMVPLPENIIEPEWLAVAVAAITLLIIGLGRVGATVDTYLAARATAEAARLRAHVTELEATQRRLEETTAALKESLEAAAAGSQAKSQFLATMSHELRTPLNAVIGFADLLMRERFGPLGDTRYRDYVHDIKKSGEHLLALINDILDYTKLDMGRMELNEEAVDLAAVAREVVRMVGPSANDAGVALATNIAADLPQISVDARRVRQVLINLLSNAVKFTPAGGAVTLTAFQNATGIVAKISDTGIGMAPEDIPKALERFGQVSSRLDRRYEGSGLGLPIAKRLMELHGGTLEITSAPDQGTTVTIAFPLPHTAADASLRAA